LHRPKAGSSVFFDTAQDRWVKELRLAGVKSRAESNALLEKKLISEINRRGAPLACTQRSYQLTFQAARWDLVFGAVA